VTNGGSAQRPDDRRPDPSERREASVPPGSERGPSAPAPEATGGENPPPQPAPPAQSYPPPPLPPSGSTPPPYPPPPYPPPPSSPRSPYPTAPYQAVRTSGLAIASMVLGIVWIFWLGSVLAVIFGHVALSQIKRSMGALGGRGMAIAGLVLGYLGLATLALVIVLAATGAIDTTTTAECRADYLRLLAAETRYDLDHGHVTDEGTLAREHYIAEESDLHEIVLVDGNAQTATDYRILPTDECD